ncbi:MAG: hypothetical protein ACK56F_29450 [bacterium]
MANDVRKCNQPGFCRYGRGAVLAGFVLGRTRRPGTKGYRSTHAGTLIKIFPGGANWASTSVARTSEQREE